MKFAPVVLFVYSRLSHTIQTIESLKKNKLAQFTDLIIYSDAPRSSSDVDRVSKVREYINTIQGFQSVKINLREKNFGLSNSIISGVTEVLEMYESIIVLEDDLVTAPFFLQYMNEALTKYKEDIRVASIHGYTYPIKNPLPETFFMRGADCWGWATWGRAWRFFNPNGQFLLDSLYSKNLISEFDFNGAQPFSMMLKGQIQGKNDSWAIRWHASIFLENMLTLYPGRSLVLNIGNDASGVHCGKTSIFDCELSSVPINLQSSAVKSSELAFLEFEDFYRMVNKAESSPIRRILGRLGLIPMIRFIKNKLPNKLVIF